VRLPLLERRETSSASQSSRSPPTAASQAAQRQVSGRSLALMREVQATPGGVGSARGGRRVDVALRRMNISQSWVGFSESPAYSDAQMIAHAISEAYVTRRSTAS